MNDAVETEQQLADLSAAVPTAQVGIVEDADWPNDQVSVVFADGVRQTMGWVLAAPWFGDRVQVLRIGGQVFCVPWFPPAIGTVVSVADGLATVLLDDGRSVTYPFTGAVPATADRVSVNHAARMVVGVYSAEPPGSEFVPPAAPPSGGQRTILFRPVWAGNWRSGGYAGQALEISDSRTAALGYGTQVRDTIPPSAVVNAATLTLVENWDEVSGTPSKLGTHADAGLPGGTPGVDLTGALDVYGSGVFDVTGFIARFRAGTAFGFGFPAGYGWRQFAPVGDLYVTFTG